MTWITVYGRSNSCSFVHKEKKVKLAPIRHTPSPETKRTDASKQQESLKSDQFEGSRHENC